MHQGIFPGYGPMKVDEKLVKCIKVGDHEEKEPKEDDQDVEESYPQEDKGDDFIILEDKEDDYVEV